jgi:hypothetical protein
MNGRWLAFLEERPVDALARLETWLQSIVEGPARWLTGQRLQPVEIARRLAVAMDDGILVTGERPIAPNRFVATLGAPDHAPLAGITESLERELERFLEAECSDRGYRFSGVPHVELRLDTAHPSGKVTVVATHEAPLDMTPAPTRVLQAISRQPQASGILLRAKGRSWTLAPGDRLVVGREATCDIVLDDDSVSRRHASITFTTVRRRVVAVEVEDLGSTNGTLVDGKAVASAVVLPGSTLSFGDVDVHVSEGTST